MPTNKLKGEKMMKKIGLFVSLSFVLSLTLGCLGLFSGCSDDPEPTPKEAEIWDGVWTGHANNKSTDPACGFKFYEDGTYYGKFIYEVDMNATEYNSEAGKWQLKSGNLEYVKEWGVDETWDTDDDVKATASRYIEFTPYGGNAYKIAYVDGVLAGGKVFNGQVDHVFFKQDADFAYDKTKETNIAILVLYYNNSADTSISLYHTGKFVDYTGTKLEGTWIQKTDASYELTSGTTKYSIAPTADDARLYTYSRYSDETLANYIKSETPVYVFPATGVDIVAGAVTGNLVIQCFEGGEAKVIANNLSAPVADSLNIDSGNWTNEGPTFTFTFKNGTATAEFDAVNMKVEVTYSGSTTLADFNNAPVSFSNVKLSMSLV